MELQKIRPVLQWLRPKNKSEWIAFVLGVTYVVSSIAYFWFIGWPCIEQDVSGFWLCGGRNGIVLSALPYPAMWVVWTILEYLYEMEFGFGETTNFLLIAICVLIAISYLFGLTSIMMLRAFFVLKNRMKKQ